ncbi:hypothetical protein EBR78_02950 [bacterium]|nr:hypothetical protein [bacterium]NBX82803.1 hypothetical protein [bacterium]
MSVSRLNPKASFFLLLSLLILVSCKKTRRVVEDPVSIVVPSGFVGGLCYVDGVVFPELIGPSCSGEVDGKCYVNGSHADTLSAPSCSGNWNGKEFVRSQEIALPVSVYLMGGGLIFLKNGNWLEFQSIGYDRGNIFSKWNGSIKTFSKIATLSSGPFTYTHNAQPTIDLYIADKGPGVTNSYASIELAMVDANQRLIAYTNGNTGGNASPVKIITDNTLTITAGEFPSFSGVTVPTGSWMFSCAGGAPSYQNPFCKNNSPQEQFQLFDSITLLSDDSQFAHVGDEGNVGDTVESYEPNNPSSSRISGFGAVSYPFYIAKNLVTLEDYAEFLNSVAEEDPHQLYHSDLATDTQAGGITRTGTSGSYRYQVPVGKSKRPVTYVSWLSAARYVNWLHNGKPVGVAGASTTEAGVYNLSSSTAYAEYPRSSEALYFIPNENEWYKAAYYKGGSTDAGYWKFATQSDTLPTAASSNGTNRANFDSVASGTTDVGLFSSSASAYGTFDQAGNVWQWLEGEGPLSSQKGRRGGSWANSSLNNPSRLSSEVRSSSPISATSQHAGFRVGKKSALQ